MLPTFSVFFYSLKGKERSFLLGSWRSMMKMAGSESASGFGSASGSESRSGSIRQRHGSAHTKMSWIRNTDTEYRRPSALVIPGVVNSPYRYLHIHIPLVNLFIPKKYKNRSYCIRYLTGSSHLIKMLEMLNLENDFLLASEMLEGWCLIGGIFAPVLTCRYKYTGNIKFRLSETNFVLEYKKYEDIHCLGISSNGN